MKPITWKKLKLDKELDVLNKFVNKKYGIVRQTSQIKRAFEDPNMNVAVAVTSRPWNTGVFPGKYFISEGSSVHEDQTFSKIGALGESLERYCSIFYNKKNMVFGSYKELNGNHENNFIHPDKFAVFAKHQKMKELDHFTIDSKIYWTKGLSLIDKKLKMVPAQSIYLPYYYNLDESYVCASISTGLAFGITLEDTIYSGLMETVERDAFSIYWLNKLEFPRIKFPFGFKELDNWYKRMFGCLDIDINVFNITNDLGIPVFFSVIKGKKELAEPFMSVGAASAIDPIAAIKKAILESFHTRKYGITILCVNYSKSFKKMVDTDAIDNNNFTNHVTKYTKQVDIDEVKFCYSPDKEIDFNDIYQQYKFDTTNTFILLREAINRLKTHDFEPIVADVTSDDVGEKLFYSIKTLVPGLHPLWAGNDIPLGGTRIYEVPEKLGFKKKTINEMNLYPHPFP